MAKIEKLKKGTATIYPATIPQAVVDPTSGKSARAELDEKANHGYDSAPKTLKAVDEAKVDKTSIVGETGQGETSVMHQKAVTDELSAKAAHGYTNSPKTLKQVDDSVSQLAGEVSLLDAIQGAKIKDIENVLSTANINQATTLSVSGRKTISLPKNASNGGMSVKLEGFTVENLVVNGDFRNGTVGWTNVLSTLSSLNNEATINTISLYGGIRQVINVSQNDKIYFKVSAKASAGKIMIAVRQPASPYGQVGSLYPSTDGIFKTYSNIAPIPQTTSPWSLEIREEQLTTNTFYVKRVMVINLTKIFGAGNEPNLATCDLMFPDYFEGVKSFEPTGRARSVGKNLFDKYKIIPNSYTTVRQIDNGVNITGTYFARFAVKLPAGSTYIMSWSQTTVSGTPSTSWRLSYIDGTLSATTPNGIAILAEKEVSEIYLYVSGTTAASANYANIILSRDIIASPYEPYKETSLYLTAPELRSNGTVKDEIRKGANGYELVKRVGVSEPVNEGAEKIPQPLNFTSGWSPVGEVTINSATQFTTTSAGGISINYVLPGLNKNVIVRIKGTVTAGDLSIRNSADNTGQIILSGAFDAVYITNYGVQAHLFLSANTAATVSIEKLSIKAIDGISTIVTPLKVWEIGANVHYTLATPVITPISYGGILNSAGNGTVYHEQVIADAGVYDTKMDILLTDYPISALEEIIVHKDGIDTYLDVSTAVIAADKLSFTHPSLASGDLVLFTYAYNKETTNGNITATFYDSNVVKIDTVTGKAYRINEVVTNGVLTRSITEV